MSIAKNFEDWRLFFSLFFLKTEKWIQWLPGNEANSNSIRYSSSTDMDGHIYLPHCDLDCWYQLLVQQGKPTIWYSHFQLPSARESSIMERKSKSKPSNFHPEKLVCKLITHQQLMVCISCIQLSCHNYLISSYSNTLLFTVGLRNWSRSMIPW